jgi:hypothetical protein
LAPGRPAGKGRHDLMSTALGTLADQDRQAQLDAELGEAGNGVAAEAAQKVEARPAEEDIADERLHAGPGAEGEPIDGIAAAAEPADSGAAAEIDGSLVEGPGVEEDVDEEVDVGAGVAVVEEPVEGEDGLDGGALADEDTEADEWDGELDAEEAVAELGVEPAGAGVHPELENGVLCAAGGSREQEEKEKATDGGEDATSHD